MGLNRIIFQWPAHEELNKNWLNNHEGHGLISCVHTEFKGTKGVRYKEIKCYTCKKQARTRIDEVQTRPFIPTKKIKLEPHPEFVT